MVRRVYGVREEPWHYRIIRSFDIPRGRGQAAPLHRYLPQVPEPLGHGRFPPEYPMTKKTIRNYLADRLFCSILSAADTPAGSGAPVCPAAFVCFFLHFPVRIQKTFPVDFLSLRDNHKRSGIDIIDDLLRLVELLSVQNTDHGLSVLFPISSFAL